LSQTGSTTLAHHLGHRERLRERALKSLDALPDYELLELFLFRTFPRGEIKPLAKALLTRFGSLGGVLAASVEELKTVPGVGEAAALDLRLLNETTLRVSRETIRRRTVIGSWSALLAYVKVALANEAREQFRVLFLDNKNQLIADEVMNRGTIDHAPVYPREVVRRALELSASAVILVHNHPSGDRAQRRRRRHDPPGGRGRARPADRGARPPDRWPRGGGQLQGAGTVLMANHMQSYPITMIGDAMTTRVLTAHVPLDLAEKVDAAAERLDRPRAWIVKQALTSWLDREERRHQMILEGLADIDAGRTVDHEAVKAWAESLGTSNPKAMPS